MGIIYKKSVKTICQSFTKELEQVVNEQKKLADNAAKVIAAEESKRFNANQESESANAALIRIRNLFGIEADTSQTIKEVDHD